jgi:hypothetical protein
MVIERYDIDDKDDEADLPTLSVGRLHIYLPRSRAPKVSRI